MSALATIKAAGFDVWLTDAGNIGIRPFDALTDAQRSYIRNSKAEIVEALAANESDPLLVTVWTPSGTPMTIRADNAEHAIWLCKMNPRPTTPTPTPPAHEPDADQISEAEHNAAGRYFKFLASWLDGSECYLCQFPRMTVAEMLAQYPTAMHIEPIENEDYPDD